MKRTTYHLEPVSESTTRFGIDARRNALDTATARHAPINWDTPSAPPTALRMERKAATTRRCFPCELT